ncbi:DAK2 domain-containing protein [Fructilactobacillus fructivorans]|uniref:Dihydroxyacetone kinase family protein n=1 Tax=Fructilactobacillus fructivorans TaxID=1614 RepID=A0A0C1PN24_9LACO|nr:DAK2 domain-containing protein [Fructilactobacillus fructivorans]KID42162.1 Dihydroxyacetone kinase family protein [Fructilactobacillus fructivorans]MCT0152055.1 DAK2 domain-containing protein [Fructilactobacillus fructivorans]MCT2867947.1 DAK2 domain-containing protein [Fructilactobacillus fructivorans]MCT2868471.1 DAK2 domain-containing protein [Fructilactobacillus fructivorans]MCT2873471.1 DAK2 domain-containing protein [Fructilactobacillus fructivorans]
MSLTKITTKEFDQMVQAAAVVLNNNTDFINSLNVFPVPDGDTGTNMSLSLSSGESYVDKSTDDTVGGKASALAKGLLMGARGNSGVIMSQIFRGFAKDVEGKKDLNAKEFADAIIAGAKTAYNSVMKPTEGTILTVVRLAAKAGESKADDTDDIIEVMDAILSASKKALKETPDLLPVLKQVGVVDSGGQGLVFVFQAFDDVLNGRKIEDKGEHQPNSEEMNEMIDVEHHKSAQGKLNPEDIVYGYCTQIMVRIGKGKQVTQKFDYDTFYNYLAKLGDSLLVINDDEVVRVHVHTEHPGKVLSWGQQFGDLATVKVDNMRLQQESIMESDEKAQQNDKRAENEKEDHKKPRDLAIIAVVAGAGLEKLFKSLGVTNIISGGQTMNPSTQDIVDAVNKSNAKKAIVLPNNKNIFLAAEQAQGIVNIPMEVVHTKTIPQGLTAMFSFDPDSSFEKNQKQMDASLNTVKSGQVTTAVRDTKINGMDIKKGSYMGIIDGNIEVLGNSLDDAAVKMLKKMLDDDSENVTIIFGKNAKASDAKKVSDAALATDDELEVETHEGDQPVYPLIISVE